MASTDTEQLVVELEARISQFEKNFQRASRSANDNWNKIESRGRSASKRMQADMDKVASNIIGGMRGVAGSLASTFGLTGALSAGGFLALMVKVNNELARMGSLAKEAGLSTDKLQEVKYSTTLGGVSDEAFTSGMRMSLQLLDEASREANDLRRLFEANGKSIRDSNGDLIKFDAFLEKASDLIARAPTEQAKTKIAEMLGLSREWVGALEKGPEQLRKLQDEARQSGVVVDEATIRKAQEFQKAWDQAIAKWKIGITAALSDIAGAFAEFFKDMIDNMPGGDILKRAFRFWGQDLKGMTLPELEAALEDAAKNSLGGAAERIAAEIDRRLGKKSFRLTVTPQVTGPRTIIPNKQTGDEGKTALDQAIYSAQRRIATMDAETATIGRNSEARERARLVAQLEEAAKKTNSDAGMKNTAVTEEQRQRINQLADAMEAAAKREREAEQSWRSFNEVLSFSGDIALQFIDGLGDRTKKLGDIAASALSMIKKAALQATILGTGPLAGIFGTASSNGGTGGLMGALGNLLGARADGGPVTANRPYIVGERGPEIVVPKMSGVVIPNHALGGTVNNAAMQSNTFNVTVQGSAGTEAQNKDLAAQIGKQLEAVAGQMVVKHIRQQMRPGGILSGR